MLLLLLLIVIHLVAADYDDIIITTYDNSLLGIYTASDCERRAHEAVMKSEESRRKES